MTPDYNFAKEGTALALDYAEKNLLEAIEACELAEKGHAEQTPGSTAFVRAANMVRERRAKLRAYRQAYAQAVLCAYGAGLGIDGKIIW